MANFVFSLLNVGTPQSQREAGDSSVSPSLQPLCQMVNYSENKTRPDSSESRRVLAETGAAHKV